MKQLTPQGLTELLNETQTRPLIVDGYQVTGILKKEVFQHIHFTNCQFFNFICHACTFEECHFTNCKIIHTDFHSSQFDSCFFEDITFFTVKFIESIFSTSKLLSVTSIKMFFEKSKIEYSKFVCSSLVASKFIACEVHDLQTQYTTLDATTINESSFVNSRFESCSMRGIEITKSVFENSSMDFINFENSLNINPSEFFIPTKATVIKQNKTTDFTLTNCFPKKHLSGFSKSFKTQIYKPLKLSVSRTVKKSAITKPAKQELQKNEVENTKDITKKRKHFFPHSVNGRNVGSLLTFFLQIIATIITVHLFATLYITTTEIFYKSIPNFIEIPTFFGILNVEMHAFAFYLSLFYFVFSGMMLCLNVVCIRGIRNLLLTWFYRGQSVLTIITLFWIWWNNISFQMGIISYFNLFTAFYFCVMFIQSFNTTSSTKTNTEQHTTY